MFCGNDLNREALTRELLNTGLCEKGGKTIRRKERLQSVPPL